MLSNVSIKRYLKSGDIKIIPWDDSMMGAARVVFHLNEKILIPKLGKVVDVVKNIVPDYKEVILSLSKPYPLKSQQFILGETFEEIGISEKIGMILDGKSTLARVGLSITQTSMIVDTGQEPKKMTLEIFNAGPNAILLYPKMQIGKGIYFLLKPAATKRYDQGGKYQKGDKLKPIFDEVLKK